ncbi:MAG: LON peptidase substrate-binding domain-containing protein [Solirubrobacterales bacterium]
MPSERLTDFPLFPLPIVLLPTEVVPLHIFEDRFKTMISLCLDEHSEFGIVWLSDDGLREVGCSATVVEVLDHTDEGHMNVLVRGTMPFRLVERSEEHVFPAGTIDLLNDRQEDVQPRAAEDARSSYADLLEQATDQRPDIGALGELNAYEMAASVDIGQEVKQGLLELRSEQARLRLLARLFKDGVKRLEIAGKIGERAQGNGKVKFDLGQQ